MNDPLAKTARPNLAAGPRWQHALGILLLLVWVTWWGLSVSLDVPHLIGSSSTYLVNVAWPYLGLEFQHEYAGGRALAEGANPYRAITGYPLYQQFTYPPVVLPFFAWCHFFPPETTLSAEYHGAKFMQPYAPKAVFIWLAILTLIFTYATYQAWRWRQKLGYGALSFALALGLILLSFPVVFSMERGSSDALMLLFIILGVLALRRKNWYWELAAGGCIAIAAWMKLYPAFLLIALVGLRRWRAAIFSLASMILIGLLTLPWTRQWVDIVASRIQVSRGAMFYGHSLSSAWNEIWTTNSAAFMTAIPGVVGAGVLILGLALVVSWYIFRSERREELALPYILWMTALATYWPLISFDYNLFYLPLAALIVWRRRDPIWVHIPLAYFLIWWQPWLIMQSDAAANVAKFAGAVAIGLSIIAKIQPEKAAALERGK